MGEGGPRGPGPSTPGGDLVGRRTRGGRRRADGDQPDRHGRGHSAGATRRPGAAGGRADMTSGGASERPSGPGQSARPTPGPESRSVHESASAPDPLPKIYIEAGSHPVLPETDQAMAEAIGEEARRERRKDRARPW